MNNNNNMNMNISFHITPNIVKFLDVGLIDYMQEYCIICMNYCIIFIFIVLYLGCVYYIHIIVLYLRDCIIFNLLYYV